MKCQSLLSFDISCICFKQIIHIKCQDLVTLKNKKKKQKKNKKTRGPCGSELLYWKEHVIFDKPMLCASSGAHAALNIEAEKSKQKR